MVMELTKEDISVAVKAAIDQYKKEEAEKKAAELKIKNAFEDEAAAAVAEAMKTGAGIPQKYAASVAAQNAIAQQVEAINDQAAHAGEI